MEGVARAYDDANPIDDAHWIIRNDSFSNAWLNIIFSSIGYAWFSFLLYACWKKGVFWRRIHEIFPILLFAFITDLIELRLHTFYIFDLQDKADYWRQNYARGMRYVPGSIEACTLAEYFAYFYIMISYVEGTIAIHRFVVHFCGKAVSIMYFYAGMGAVFVLKALLLLATFIFGRNEYSMMYCTRHLELRIPTGVSAMFWMLSLPVAPVLSLLVIVKGCMRKEQGTGVSLFIFTSSSAVIVLIISYIPYLIPRPNYRGPSDAFVLFYSIANIIQDFRFLLLCMLATFIVVDIRGAVFSTTVDIIRMLLGRPPIPSTITNDEYAGHEGTGDGSRIDDVQLL